MTFSGAPLQSSHSGSTPAAKPVSPLQLLPTATKARVRIRVSQKTLVFKFCLCQNGWVDIWVMCFHFRASIKPIFENHVLRAVSGPFHPLYETKISNRSLSVVYGSITLKFFSGALGTSPHQWFNRDNKIQKKVFFGTP